MRPEATTPRQALLQRLSSPQKAMAAVIAAVALAGLTLFADGAYMTAKAQLSQVLLKRAFAAGLAGDPMPRPWPWADFVSMAEIRVPRIGQSAIVLAGASGETLAFGPAWLTTTPRPGEDGTAVIAAHRDSHFRWLKDVRPGDRIELRGSDGDVALQCHKQQGQLTVLEEDFQPLLLVQQGESSNMAAPFLEVPRGDDRQQVGAITQGDDGAGHGERSMLYGSAAMVRGCAACSALRPARRLSACTPAPATCGVTERPAMWTGMTLRNGCCRCAAIWISSSAQWAAAWMCCRGPSSRPAKATRRPAMAII